MFFYIFLAMVPFVNSCNISFTKIRNTTLTGFFFDFNISEQQCFGVCARYELCSGIIYNQRGKCQIYSSSFYEKSFENTDYYKKQCVSETGEESVKHALVVTGVLIFIMFSCILSLYARRMCSKENKTQYEAIL